MQHYPAARPGRPVEFYAAPNFDGFSDALLAGSVDIAICPPHFAALTTSAYGQCKCHPAGIG